MDRRRRRDDEDNGGRRRIPVNLGSMDRTIRIHLPIPIPVCGLVIGRHGATINNLKERSGADVRLQEQYDIPPGANVRDVMLIGRPEQIRSCTDMLLKVFRDEPNAKSCLDDLTAERRLVRDIPSHLAGLLIGVKGATIQTLQKESGARISIQSTAEMTPNATTRTVTLMGSHIALQLAEGLIGSIMEEDRRLNPGDDEYRPEGSSGPSRGYDQGRDQGYGGGGPPPSGASGGIQQYGGAMGGLGSMGVSPSMGAAPGAGASQPSLGSLGGSVNPLGALGALGGLSATASGQPGSAALTTQLAMLQAQMQAAQAQQAAQAAQAAQQASASQPRTAAVNPALIAALSQTLATVSAMKAGTPSMPGAAPATATAAPAATTAGSSDALNLALRLQAMAQMAQAGQSGGAAPSASSMAALMSGLGGGGLQAAMQGAGMQGGMPGGMHGGMAGAGMAGMPAGGSLAAGMGGGMGAGMGAGMGGYGGAASSMPGYYGQASGGAGGVGMGGMGGAGGAAPYSHGVPDYGRRDDRDDWPRRERERSRERDFNGNDYRDRDRDRGRDDDYRRDRGDRDGGRDHGRGDRDRHPNPPRGPLEGYDRVIDIPTHQAGLILGKGGNTIKTLQSRSGATMRLESKDEVEANAPIRRLYIRGNPKEVSVAENMVFDMLRDDPSGLGQPNL